MITLHSPAPSYYELISFKQCFKVLAKHDIYVVAPKGLHLTEYHKVVPTFKEVRVEKKWLDTKLDYNKLKLSRYFYNLFSDYTYMLTYELDAFIFSDELEQWCDKGYDYIGSPWFEGFDIPNAEIIGVGNSGFSLRKIRTIKRGIKRVYYVDPTKFSSFRKIKYIMQSKALISRNLHKLARLRNLLNKENATIQNAGFLFEDRVIVDQMAKTVRRFKLAPVEEAIKFSFEVNPDVLYKMNNNTLPMGCHAWWVYDLQFWKPFIESHGYKI